MFGKAFGRLLVEFVDGTLIPARMIGGAGGDWIDEMHFDLILTHVARGNTARDAAAVLCAVKGDDICFADHTRSLDRDQFRVARSDAHAPQLS